MKIEWIFNLLGMAAKDPLYPVNVNNEPYKQDRPYKDALALGYIDPNIEQLVMAMNVPCVIATHSSCGGHKDRFQKIMLPYVKFSSAKEIANKLSDIISIDQRTARRLWHRWEVKLCDDGKFCLTLSAETLKDRFRFHRELLNVDLHILREFVIRAIEDKHFAANQSYSCY